MDLNKLDKKILNLLSTNARQSFRKMGEELGVSTATVIKHVSTLEEKGVIDGYYANINYDRIGYEFMSSIVIKYKNGQRFDKDTIMNLPEVYRYYEITGNADAVINALFKRRHELDTFLKKLNGYEFIERARTGIILSNFNKNITIE